MAGYRREHHREEAMIRSHETMRFVTCLDQTATTEVQAFLRHHYGEGFYGANEAYFDWQYIKNPCKWFAPELADGKMSINGVYDDKTNEIVAVHAYVPFDAHLGPRLGRGVWDTEWINGSGVKGLGRELATYLLSQSDVYAGFGMNDMANQSFEALGLKIFPEISRHVAVLDHTNLTTHMAASDYVNEANNVPASASFDARLFHVLESAAAIPDSVIAQERKNTAFGVARDSAWMIWRFEQHPFISYTIVAADPDGANGVAVVRTESVVDTDHHVCRIIEFYAMPGQERTLLEATLSYAADKDALIVDYFTASSSRAELFQQTTSCQSLGMNVNPTVPFMFQPLYINERNSLNMAIKTSVDLADAFELGTFHATKGDSDQDILRSEENAPAF
jgi:hypothetical protein